VNRRRRERGPASSARRCPACGAIFIPTKGDQKYCRRECGVRVGDARERWRRFNGDEPYPPISELLVFQPTPDVRVCSTCRATFTVPAGRPKTYCSPKCANDRNRSRVTRPSVPATEPVVVAVEPVVEPTAQPTSSAARPRSKRSKAEATAQAKLRAFISCEPPQAALPLKAAVDALEHLGIYRTGPREENRCLAYDLQSAADGLDRRQVGDLLDHLRTATDKAGVLRLTKETPELVSA
jgi:hypothetical protein